MAKLGTGTIDLTGIGGGGSGFISGQIEAPKVKTYTLDLSSVSEKTIQTITLKTTTGTATADVKIDGTTITGMSAISISSTETTATATALNSLAVGQTLTLVVTAISSPVDLVFTLLYAEV